MADEKMINDNKRAGVIQTQNMIIQNPGSGHDRTGIRTVYF